MYEKITWVDFIIGLIYGMVLLFIMFFYAKKKKKQDNRYVYFFPVFLIKMLVAFGFVLFFRYYYYGGDTFVYFMVSKDAVIMFFEDPVNFWKFLLSSRENFEFYSHPLGIKYGWFISSIDGFAMAKIMVFFNMLGLNSYISTTFVMCLLSFWGLWKMYLTFSEIYPDYAKSLVYGILLVPSVMFWGSAILKDTLVIACIGLIVHGLYEMLVKQNQYYRMWLLILCFYLIFVTKPYVLYVFAPLVFLWIFNLRRKKITGRLMKLLIGPIYYIVVSSVSGLIVYQVMQHGGKYSLNTLEKTLEGFYTWHKYLAETQNQAGYDLGEFDPSFTGILKKVPAAINVSLFRPYPWEVRSLTMLMGSFEAVIFTLMTIFVILQVGFFRTLKIIFNDENLKFFFIFSILFAAMVGLTSYNFGALNRYKIPMMPFYATLMIVVYQKALDRYRKRKQLSVLLMKKNVLKHLPAENSQYSSTQSFNTDK